MTTLLIDQLLNTGSHKVQFWIHYFLTLMWLTFYINVEVENYAGDSTPYFRVADIPTTNSEF